MKSCVLYTNFFLFMWNRYTLHYCDCFCGNATLEEGKGRSGFLKMENVTYHVHRAVTRGVSGFFLPGAVAMGAPKEFGDAIYPRR